MQTYSLPITTTHYSETPTRSANLEQHINHRTSEEQTNFEEEWVEGYFQYLLHYSNSKLESRQEIGSMLIRSVLTNFYEFLDTICPDEYPSLDAITYTLSIFNKGISSPELIRRIDSEDDLENNPDGLKDDNKLSPNHISFFKGIKGELKTMLLLCHLFGKSSVIIPNWSHYRYKGLHPDLILSLNNIFVMIEVKANNRLIQCAGNIDNILSMNPQSAAFIVENYLPKYIVHSRATRYAWQRYHNQELYPDMKFLPAIVTENTSNDFNMKLDIQLLNHVRSHHSTITTSTY